MRHHKPNIRLITLCAIHLVLLITSAGTRLAVAQDDPLPLAIELLQPLMQEDTALNWEELSDFYSAERFQPVWIRKGTPSQKAVRLRQCLHKARREGLVPERYHIKRIDTLWSSDSAADRLQLELLLTSAFFDYARDVRSGQIDPEKVAPLWQIKKVPVDVVTMLRLALLMDDFGEALDSLPPNHPAYRRLREALARYRTIKADGGWPYIPGGPLLRKGVRDPRVPALRHRLAMVGDLELPKAADEKRFDAALAYAVRRFQVRYGLEVDGVVGKGTLAALNVPIDKRIEQIVMTMERWRWLPQYLGRRHLIVNIPAYELIAYEDGEAKLSMPVIIGSKKRPTPVTSGLMHTVVFNPYWTVPRKIAVRDIVPRQRHNPEYMSSHHIRVFASWNDGQELDPHQIDWRAVNINHFPYMLRQDPGPDNALGKTKFLFSNRFSVYLHDTPHESLFAHSVRAYSSGCIRLEEPLRLANFVLAEEKDWRWNDAMLRAVIDTDLTYRLQLSSPVPVYLLYLTAWVGEDGAVHFRRDVYGEDALMSPCMPFEEQSL
jgi:murein L,D-transpeptidase YcbB/YkuD